MRDPNVLIFILALFGLGVVALNDSTTTRAIKNSNACVDVLQRIADHIEHEPNAE